MSERKSSSRNRALAGSLLAVFLLPAPALLRAQDAREIMQGVYQQDTSRDTSLRARLDVTDASGQTLRKRFVLFRKGPPGNGKTLLRFSEPAELRGVTLLSINQTGVTDRQWIYLPATARVRGVTPRERSERFAGSDFTYEDVAERVLDDFTYRLLSADETMDNRKTFKIAATPVGPDRSQYKNVYYWIAQDVPCILHAEMYDQEGHEVRELHASGLKKVSNIWGARRVEMHTVAENTKTVLTIDEVRFNTGLEDALFTPEGMSKAPADLKQAQ
jgi:hypothetical protein